MTSLHSAWTVFIVGFCGGFLGDILGLYELRQTDPANLPKYIRSKFYWGMNILMASLGGGLALLYGFKDVNALLVVNIGASAPLIIKALATNAPRIQPPKVN